MTNQNGKNLEQIADIACGCDIDAMDVIRTFTYQSIKLAKREGGMYNVTPTQKNYDEAMPIVTRYYKIHHNYNPKWAE